MLCPMRFARTGAVSKRGPPKWQQIVQPILAYPKKDRPNIQSMVYLVREVSRKKQGLGNVLRSPVF